MSLKAFLKTKLFWKHVSLAVGITIALLFSTNLILKVYTHHGESIAIPDLRGKSESEIARILDDLDLKYQITDSIFSAGIEPGTVVDQIPRPGYHVKENRTVFITLCAINPEKIPMPRLTDISFRQAVNMLETAGLAIGEVEYVASEYENLVLDQKVNGTTIAPGTLIAKGSIVDLTIGQTGNGAIGTVPDLTGLTLKEARLTLGDAMLNVGSVIFDQTVRTHYDSIDATVWKQMPEANSQFRMEPGASIDIWLGKTTIQNADSTENDIF